MKTLEKKRIKLTINGIVQGVGFRPFIYVLAKEIGINGWVKNTSIGVIIEAESSEQYLKEFSSRIKTEKPSNSVIDSFISEDIDVQDSECFEIIISDNTDKVSTSILPDLAVCEDCKKELLDPNDRRYKYPFINCTNCGPRWSIINALPYDRPYTSMADFEMCEACAKEYKDPMNRRFHAQPVACHDCGPQIKLKDVLSKVLGEKNEALNKAVEAIKHGKIIALKGLAGFHIIADANNEKAVARLRSEKYRPSKPFALMYPNIEMVERDCFVSDIERKILTSQQAPIVLLKHKDPKTITDLVAPNNPYLGVMLPYTPLHILLMNELQIPVVATSGNKASEPICIDESEVSNVLGDMVDMFLIHNRPIVQRADDSIIKVIADTPVVLRRARGYAPRPIMLHKKVKEPILAAGGHLKNTVALIIEDKIILSPHICDLDTLEGFNVNQQTMEHLCKLYQVKPDTIACDKHPDYSSTKNAKKNYKNVLEVQHHVAHAFSCMLENDIEGSCTAIVWDGTGLGDNNNIWGGECFKIDADNNYYRELYLKEFKLPGGETAIKSPRRVGFGILKDLGLSDKVDFGFTDEKIKVLEQMIDQDINSPVTSSAGRLFDSVSSILGIKHKNSFEGEAAMNLEFLAEQSDDTDVYNFKIEGKVIDWSDIVREIVVDKENGVDVNVIAKRFHNTMAETIVTSAKILEEKKVLLSGGCFQNKVLVETAIEKLKKEGFEPYFNKEIPTNDGGISAGQAFFAIKNNL